MVVVTKSSDKVAIRGTLPPTTITTLTKYKLSPQQIEAIIRKDNLKEGKRKHKRRQKLT